MDYFKDCQTLEEIYAKPLKIEEKIPDRMPKYYVEPTLEELLKGAFTSSIRDSTTDMTKEHLLRQAYVDMGMFCFVSWKWVNPLVEYLGKSRCLEVMAGRGWLSYALQQKGIDIIATDNYSWHKMKEFAKWNQTVMEVENVDAVEAVRKYGKDIDYVLIMWAYMDNTAYQTIKELYKVNPRAKVIVCGEGPGGCTADDEFFNHFEELEGPDGELFYKNVAKHYERWWGLRDQLTIGRYKPNDVSIKKI